MPDKTDFKSIRIHCDSNSSLSGKVIDDFLMHFAARQENLEREMEKCLARYQHITRDIIFPRHFRHIAAARRYTLAKYYSI